MITVPRDYKELLDKNIQKDYKKAEKRQETKINKKAKVIAEKLELADRVEAMARRDAFITLKDHKPNFNNAPTCRLINPTKSEIGKVAKQILQKIVKNTALATKVNLWRNTRSVLEWFNAIENKHSALCDLLLNRRRATWNLFVNYNPSNIFACARLV